MSPLSSKFIYMTILTSNSRGKKSVFYANEIDVTSCHLATSQSVMLPSYRHIFLLSRKRCNFVLISSRTRRLFCEKLRWWKRNATNHRKTGRHICSCTGEVIKALADLMACFHCPTPILTPIPIPISMKLGSMIMFRTVSTEPRPIPIDSYSYSNSNGYCS